MIENEGEIYPKHLLIGGGKLAASIIPVEFERIGSDYLSLYEAQQKRAFVTYDAIVFWPDDDTFNFTRVPSQFEKVKRVFPGKDIKRFKLDELLEARKNNSPDWTGKWLNHRLLWLELETLCHEFMRPLVSRVLRGGNKLVIVLNPDACKPAYCGWFCRQLSSYEAETSKITKICADNHPLANLVNTLLPSYGEFHTAFTVQQFVESDEFPVDCIGKSVSIDALTRVRSYSSAEEFCDLVNDSIAYSGELVISGLKLDYTSHDRAVMLTVHESGILVVPEPDQTELFLKIIVGECDTITNKDGYFYQQSPDSKTFSIYAWGRKIGSVKSSSNAFKVIKYMIDNHHDLSELSYDEIQKNVLNSCGTVAWSVRNNAFKRNEQLFDALFVQNSARRCIRLKGKSGA